MDPLSIATSCLTLFAAAGTISNKLKCIKDAAEDLHNLVDELTDFQRLLRQTNELIDVHHAEIPDDQLSDLAAILERARKVFSELEAIQNRVVRFRPSVKPVASKIAWTMQSSRITALQNRLGGIKLSLSTVLSCMAM